MNTDHHTPGTVLYEAMAENSSTQIFDPRRYLESLYSYLNKKPGEEPELLEFILIQLHEYMQEGLHACRSILFKFCYVAAGAVPLSFVYPLN